MQKLTPKAKSLLSSTIRELRDRLLRDIRDAAEADYRLSIRARDAGLGESKRIRRRRLDEWLDERVRAAKPKNEKAHHAARDRFLAQAVKEAASTLLNRLVLIRHMEALELIKPPVVTGGWNSKGVREFRDFAPGLLGDETEGYDLLLRLLFDELALDLPGLFGDVGVTRLFRVPAASLREVVERLDDPRLESAWADDTTLGWVYQYWNDPEREALDAKINSGGKVEPHEIASKTQMFTERYMVEWLLHNSLGLTWLCMCRKQGWNPDAELVLDDLDERRADWRAKREAGEVELDALMPIVEGLEDRWKYYVPQPIPDDAVASAPESIRDLKLLDPACGSGHFLVIAFDLLAELYREEARHRGEDWSDRQIAEWILERNLHGVDIDPRAIQIAAAGLYLKARLLSRDASIQQLNLVAPALNLSSLPEDDPALQRLLAEVRQETGIPEELTRKLVASLAGVDHLGSLLKVDAAVDEALQEYEKGRGLGPLFSPHPSPLPAGEGEGARETLLAKLEQFLSHHGSEEDLGLRLDGEQLAAGVRFVRIVRENTYDIVIGNPPYQGTSRMVDAKYVANHYPRGKADLYAAFLERMLEMSSRAGTVAIVAMRNWMFISQFKELRSLLLHEFDIRTVGDLGTGAFSSRSMDDVISSAMLVVRRSKNNQISIALQVAPLVDKQRDAKKPARRRAALLVNEGRCEFDSRGFWAIERTPIVYWWSKPFIENYAKKEKLASLAPPKVGLQTGDNLRFIRRIWEVSQSVAIQEFEPRFSTWARLIKGAEGTVWLEPVRWAIRWACNGLGVHLHKGAVIRNSDFYFRTGVSYSTIGSTFSARIHRSPSVIGDMGSSVFPESLSNTVCALNSRKSRFVLNSLNPTMHFTAGDISRLPLFDIGGADEIVDKVTSAFSTHESRRETSPEFKSHGPSPWAHTQDWAQRAVDRPAGVQLPPYEPEYDPLDTEQVVSFGVGVALGRFGRDGQGILDETKPGHRELIEHSLPAGILFLSDASEQNSLPQEARGFLREMWAEHGKAIAPNADLRTYLRTKFFAYHKKLYENRPIYFPLSSAQKTFVAWVSIHRWCSDTLQTLLAEHLMPERRRLDGELEDLRKARAEGANTKLEKRFDKLKKALEELQDFIEAVTEIAERGAPPTDAKCPPREADARFEMDLDDGVMVNSAALWPLLEPQWKTGACPKKWWKELCDPKGKKDYDWSHLAARYFPTRVDEKCQEDPSLGVAHGRFWKYHPAKAYQWELRLQDEIRPDFTIDEEGSDEYRAAFLTDHPAEAEEIRAKEMKRREKKRKKDAKKKGESDGPLFESLDGGKDA